ncbi:hypothetical protein [Paracidovorax cattleyae]|uniref:hypothetical protein n=1 Tax=Paracidovorax cattleyae TaxID=80868 RepID=UPI00115FF86B|nr:hypothetical protein [Paracidovorax cattleyae]
MPDVDVHAGKLHPPHHAPAVHGLRHRVEQPVAQPRVLHHVGGMYQSITAFIKNNAMTTYAITREPKLKAGRLFMSKYGISKIICSLLSDIIGLRYFPEKNTNTMHKNTENQNDGANPKEKYPTINGAAKSKNKRRNVFTRESSISSSTEK